MFPVCVRAQRAQTHAENVLVYGCFVSEEDMDGSTCDGSNTVRNVLLGGIRALGFDLSL